MKEEDMKKVAAFFSEAVDICVQMQAKSGPKLVDFVKLMDTDEEFVEKIESLRFRIEAFADGFAMPGHEDY